MVSLPNFLIVGVAKAGTTSLYRYVMQHPQVYMSPVKEPHFFAFEGQLVDFRGPGDASKLNRTAITDFSDYCRQFEPANGAAAIGEASVLYMYYPNVPQRIHEYIPAAKLIVLLRNPVDRAYSNFLHLVRDAREPLASFEQALDAEAERIHQNWAPIWHYKSLGFYHEQLLRYQRCFAKEQIRVYLYDEFVRSPQFILQDIFRFLTIDEQFQPDVTKVYNASGVPKSRTLQHAMARLSSFKSIASAILPQKIQQQMHEMLDTARAYNLDKPPLSTISRRHLLEFYRDDILRTQDLIQKDLSAWLSI